MAQTPLVETWHNAGFLVSTPNGHRHVDKAVLAAGARVLAGTVLGQVTTGSSASATAIGSNTGNGTFGAISTVNVPTQIGAYGVLFTSATAFTVTAPNGVTAAGTVGTPFSGLGIGFTISAGGTAFVAGDSFTITTVAAVGKPTATSVAGMNTGTGTLGSLTTTGYAPKLGMYAVEFDSATNFIVSDPIGQEVGHGSTGTAFSGGGLNFTITAGGTAFVPADSFAITVVAGSNKYLQSVRTAVDGSQTPAGILWSTTDATLGDQSIAVVKRACEVNASELIWDASYTAADIVVGLAQLGSLGIITR